MSRIKRLLHPAPQALNWKAAVPLLALAGACLGIYSQAVAADTTAARADARPVLNFSTCTKPQYPVAALQAKQTGTVTLSFQVNAAGKVEESSVVSSSGHPELDEAARSSIARCNFKPALASGKAVSSPIKVQYVWTLD